MKVALGLEYDGSGFCGWQSQAVGCGVQDALESALAQIAGHPVRVHAAGRTDAGVHALMQVAHFETVTDRPDSAWIRGVNSLLPPAIRVLWACRASNAFHARFSAQCRGYQYLLLNRPIATAVLTRRVGWFHQVLDVSAMQEAALCLLGEHDFSSFRAAECQAKSPVKNLRFAELRQFGEFILFNFRADAFLHHQVRNMVGALVYIGKGSYPPVWMAELLESKNRTHAPPTFSPEGLYLTSVEYAPEFKLPSTGCSLTEFIMPGADRAGTFS